MVLADPERVVAPLAEHLGEERVLHRDVGVRPRVAGGRLRDARVAVLVVVATGEEARPGGRAQRGGVPLRVGEALVGEPLHRRHLDATAVGRPRRQPGVVVEDDEDVRRALRRRRLGVGIPVGRRVADVDVDDSVEGLAHGRAPWFEGPEARYGHGSELLWTVARGSVSRSPALDRGDGLGDRRGTPGARCRSPLRARRSPTCPRSWAMHQLLADPVEVGGQLVEHSDGGDVDEGHRLGVEDHALHAGRVGVRLDGLDGRRRRWRRTARPRRGAPATAGSATFSGCRSRSPNWSGLPGDVAELGDVRPRRAVEEEQQRHDDADEQPGQGVEDEHAEHGRHRGDEVGPGRASVDRAQPSGVEAGRSHAGRRCRPAR